MIAQSVMLSEIYTKYHFDEEPAFVVTREVLYADDTSLVSSSNQNLQRLLDAVVHEGAKYGFELNWNKTFQMAMGSTGSIARPGGGVIEKKENVVYLGGLISCDGKTTRELTRRISEGHGVFKSLCKLWSHSGITQKRKLLTLMHMLGVRFYIRSHRFGC